FIRELSARRTLLANSLIPERQRRGIFIECVARYLTSDGGDSTRRAARRRERVGLFCFFHALDSTSLQPFATLTEALPIPLETRPTTMCCSRGAVMPEGSCRLGYGQTHGRTSRLSFAKTRFICVFNNFARHSPNQIFRDQNLIPA